MTLSEAKQTVTAIVRGNVTHDDASTIVRVAQEGTVAEKINASRDVNEMEANYMPPKKSSSVTDESFLVDGQ